MVSKWTIFHIIALVKMTSANIIYLDKGSDFDYKLYTREDWSARPPKSTTRLRTPVSYVVVHHSATPAACYDEEHCCQAMRSMQNYHMDGNGWSDIGYNFAVGSDGAVYEGRGWTTLGAHALHFNTVSIGICLIGDWRYAVPPSNQLNTTKSLIQHGIDQGMIAADYTLVGHRQVRSTECPGQALYDEIKTWSHYNSSKFLVNQKHEVEVQQAYF